MEQLNEIVFRFLVPEIERRVEALPDGLYAIDAVNLLESGLDHLCDQTIAVTAPLELRVRRIMARAEALEGADSKELGRAFQALVGEMLES